MRYFIKTVLMILLSVGLIQDLLHADKDKSPDGVKHPIGMESASFITGNKEQYNHVNDKHNTWINKENLKKFTEIEKWMKAEGLTFNDDNLTLIAEGINSCVNKMWRDAIRKLLDCDTFEKHLNGETKKRQAKY
jgi:hypothetical protein